MITAGSAEIREINRNGTSELELIEDETEISPDNPVTFQSVELRWQPAPGRYRFARRSADRRKQAEHAVAYARTEFTAPAAMLAKRSIGFNDSLAVQLNGGEVFRDDMVKMPCRLDQKLVDARLQEGRNSLLFKVGQATRGWFAMARLLPSSAERPQGYLLTEMPGECRAEALHTLTLSWLIKQGNARDAANRLFNRVNWMLIDKRCPLKRS